MCYCSTGFSEYMRQRDRINQHLCDPEPERLLHRLRREQRTEQIRDPTEQRAAQPAAVAPQRSTIERMARYRSIDFLGRKEDEPSMAKNWLERTERMLVQMHCTPDESLECATALL